MDFGELFNEATKLGVPYPYQSSLAQGAWPDLLSIPTGLGKTAAVTFAWLYKRGWCLGGRRGVVDGGTPRRLVWCLPMRVLVEQTQRNIYWWLTRLDIAGEAGDGKVSVHVLMGGESDLRTWAEHPDEDMILIGTQDMLLSRALMRGYGMSRYQWPVHFALLHNDCLWAFDEVQLMGAGLTTSAQIDAFRRRYDLGRASRSLWLSATLNRDWLGTVDMAPHLPGLTTLGLSEADHARAGDRLAACKDLLRAEPVLDAGAGTKAGAAAYLDAVRDTVLAAHDPSSQTLVIVNRVDRAQGLFQRLRKVRPNHRDLLIHARFRPAERAEKERCLREEPEADRIIIATQAIEAGVDISSKVLFTELAPWASLVQRFGRCNRYGEHNASGAHVHWIDIADDADALPYVADALASARGKLEPLTVVGPSDLPETNEPRPLTPVLRRKDLLDLFNTDPDLSGFDVDVSDYIRDSDRPGLQVFWRDVDNPNDPEPQPAPQRNELCPISIGQAKGLAKRSAWRWDSLAGEWQPLDRDPRPGVVVMLDAAQGGYDAELGFDLDVKAPVDALPPGDGALRERFGDDWRSRRKRPVALSEHLGNAARQAKDLCESVGETEFAPTVVRADRWHDVGKAHEVFDATMHGCDEAPGGFLAKSPCRSRHQRPYFRHELASALAWLAQRDDPQEPNPEVDLIAYLIAAHHGKVRMSLRSMPEEKPAPGGLRYARGIWEGDLLPALNFDGETSAETELRLALMELGDGEQGRSWTLRVLELLDEHGPFRLAWLETLVRIADWRASAAEQEQESGSDE